MDGSEYAPPPSCCSHSRSVSILCILCSIWASHLPADFFVLEEKFRPPASTIGAPMLAVSFGVVYSLWIEHAATINQKFPYPFLNELSGGQRGIFYMFAIVGALFTFRLLNGLHR